ncbi:CD209 antigen-like protein C isoform X2 [Sceloporus undulatus]|nr:CD209 antigen-like protein C isoform X2 [Sceloporus undulatus]
MKKLRSTMAIGLRSPQLNYENPLRVAEEVVQLPTHIERAEKDFKDRKIKYLTLFKKGARSSGGWQLFGRSFYYISKGQKTWYDAENFCLSRDSHLASILSDEEQNYINSQLKQSTWIGLSDEEVEGNWEWTDGSSLTTQYWSDGHPRPTWESGEEEKDCAFIEPFTGGPNWSEANCHEVKQWVCKETLEVKRP